MHMPLTGPDAGDEFRRRIEKKQLLCLIGVYDVFSAQLAASAFEGVFCSGYSYAASAYGLPDVGYVNWRDITDFATKIRHVFQLRTSSSMWTTVSETRLSRRTPSATSSRTVSRPS